MRPNKHQTVRGADWLLVLGIGLGVGAGGAVARHELEWAFTWWESMRAMVGMQPPMETVPQPSELDRARAVQRRLRGQLADLEIQRRELEGRIRLLEIRSPLDVARSSSEDEQSKRRSQLDAHARQLIEIRAQIEGGQAMLRRVDRLVQEREIGATIDHADQNLLLEAAELVWTADPGRTGPNAVIENSEWSAR
jgi:hypothetical protein